MFCRISLSQGYTLGQIIRSMPYIMTGNVDYKLDGVSSTILDNTGAENWTVTRVVSGGGWTGVTDNTTMTNSVSNLTVSLINTNLRFNKGFSLHTIVGQGTESYPVPDGSYFLNHARYYLYIDDNMLLIIEDGIRSFNSVVGRGQNLLVFSGKGHGEDWASVKVGARQTVGAIPLDEPIDAYRAGMEMDNWELILVDPRGIFRPESHYSSVPLEEILKDPKLYKTRAFLGPKNPDAPEVFTGKEKEIELGDVKIVPVKNHFGAGSKTDIVIEGEHYFPLAVCPFSSNSFVEAPYISASYYYILVKR